MRFIKELEAKEGKRKVEDDRERSRIDFQSTDLHNSLISYDSVGRALASTSVYVLELHINSSTSG